MDNQLPTTVINRSNGILIEVCHGEIPDIFRQLHFGPIVEPELPDSPGTNEEFQKFLHRYRYEYSWATKYLLDEIQ